MKRVFCGIVWGFIFISNLSAEDFSHKFDIDNVTPFVKEPIVLVLELAQTNKDMVMFFDFTIEKSSDYEFHRLDIKEEDEYHSAVVKYTYRLYPLVSGDVDISFSLTKKTTTDESIAYSFSGDRDNVKTLVTKDTKILLKPITISVKSIPDDVKIVGDFNLTYSLGRLEVKPFEPISFKVVIDGYGYPPLRDGLPVNDENFTLFKEKPIVDEISSILDVKSKTTYSMALSSNSSFILSPLEIKAFNPKLNKAYTLKIPVQSIIVVDMQKDELLDKKDYPLSLKTSIDFSYLLDSLVYLFIFLSGYITAFIIKQKKSKTKKVEPSMWSKIDKCSDKKSLLRLLISSKKYEFSKSIEMLEDSIYGATNIELKEVKKELKRSLNAQDD